MQYGHKKVLISVSLAIQVKYVLVLLPVPFTAQKSLKHRRVKHFGYEFRYDNNNVDRDRPLPGGEHLIGMPLSVFN